MPEQYSTSPTKEGRKTSGGFEPSGRMGMMVVRELCLGST